MFLVAFLTAILASTPEAKPQPPVVVELFTSQGCSSCPPAEEYLRELADDPNIIALEWHVDYWDQLQHGRAGNWKDPYSSPKHTARQRAYNVALRGRGSVYTPQTVINGVMETVGSRRLEIRKLMKNTTSIDAIKTHAKDNHIYFEAPALKGLEAHLVTFEKATKTRIRGGENNGREATSAHVVISVSTLISLDKERSTYRIDRPGATRGCALLLQEPGGGPIWAAVYCPS